MALETLILDGKFYDKYQYVSVDQPANKITFKIQMGAIKEVGENGCQVDNLISIARDIVSGLNTRFPCRENALVITKLEEALHWLEHRTKNRIDRGVEGFSQV